MFKLIKEKDGYAIGVVLPEGGLYPLTGFFSDYSELRKELDRIFKDLKNLEVEIEDLKNKASAPYKISPDMDVEKIWGILSKIEDEEEFVSVFNGLSEEKRKEIADFVFSKCNVFSGKGAIFSLRYNSSTFLLE